MTKDKFDEYLSILYDTSEDPTDEEDEGIDLRHASFSTFEEDEEPEEIEEIEPEEDIIEEEPEAIEPDIEEEPEPIEPVVEHSDIDDVEPEEEKVEEIEIEPVAEVVVEEDEKPDTELEIKDKDAFTLTDAFAIISSTIDENNKNVSVEAINFAMGFIEGKIDEKLYSLNPNFVSRLKQLTTKLENYKKEFVKAKNDEHKLYLVASGELKLYKFIEEFGNSEQVLKAIDETAENWYKFIEDTIDLDMKENRDIGAVLYKIQESRESNTKPQNK